MNIKSFAILAGVAALAACSDNSSNPDALKGANFIANAGETDIILVFAPDDMRVNGSIVNLYNGTYQVNGNTITFGPMATTMMMGPADAMQVEQEYLQFLNTVNYYELENGKLVLKNPDGKEIIFNQVEIVPNDSGIVEPETETDTETILE